MQILKEKKYVLNSHQSLKKKKRQLYSPESGLIHPRREL